ncbi:hybrid sensor histidine kinase/response regulator [Kovacikia minuta CCNUW1]|uniref:hybrid sensor histidine kinase/response regulator n=1 Tax=Kovacikia minuta TaxID=2931930 RepID=UPI001CCBB967|nr:hybrid sensor histidine kinase/response regulator [Kovacikia minuta]UBF24713.1 hybrid sensor histidine kinase/response regulator [Kovacikia minuta CCNUW1]
MSHDKELEIQRQFLDEAQEYLSTLESAVLGLASSRIDGQKINAALRAAHSIKGGAGMMGFHTLSDLAHRLEDSFKVLKTQKQSITVDSDLEHLLLSGVDCLRYEIHSKREVDLRGDRLSPLIDYHWLETQANPIFDQLHQRLGEPQAEDAVSVLASEESQDILPVLFETEVEGSLQRLETVLAAPGKPLLQEELAILAQELGGLGEMLQLSPFSQLCESVGQAIATYPSEAEAIAQAALQSWRRSQALILTGQVDLLPTEIEFAPDVSSTEQLQAEPFEPFDQREEFLDDSEQIIEQLNEQLNEYSIEPSLEQSIEPSLEQPIEPPQETPVEWELPSVLISPTPVPLIQEPAPSARQTRSVGTSQVTDFKVLEVKSDPSSDAAEEDPDATVRVPIKQLNRLNDLLGELTIERNALDLYLKRLRNLSQSLKRRVQILDQSNAQMRTAYDRKNFRLPILDFKFSSPGKSVKFLKAAELDPKLHTPHPTSHTPHPTPHSNDFDTLEMDRYDDLHLLSQQVMETIVQIQEVSSDIELSLDDSEQATRNLNKTARQMQTSLTQVRMRPLSDIVDRFPRALRELCLQHGKKAKLSLLGSNTLIDRNILEALNDPLMHLLRNAFDHGIEAPEVRIAHSKPEEGTIEIRAFHQGNRTFITLRDDGGGIPVDKIRNRAEQMGLDPTLLAAASDEELLSLIFEPGFSTADQVTSLSGRGVGMDVVRNSLQQVRGEIKVDTQLEVGTTFTISVPLTLSVVRVLLVESNGMMLAFPTDTISEMITLRPEEVMNTAGSEVFAWGEAIVQLIVLSRWLEFRCPRQPNTSETPPNINAPTVLMVSQGNQLVGIQVDRCWGEQEVAVRRVDSIISMPPGFTNCTIMGDGRVVPLVNVPELLHWITSYGWSPTPQPSPMLSSQPSLTPTAYPLISPATPPSLPPQKATILVVDDSINVRRFLALTLEKAGYQVEQAKDGQDALERLQRGLHVQAVICDIEMPRLDGYGFLAKVKAKPTLEHLPIIMLTSRSGDKHRQLAMNLGATAYFSKPYNEQTLLRNLEQILGINVPVG